MVANMTAKHGYVLSIPLIALIIMGGISQAKAGEALGTAIPLRTTKIQKGDWFLFRLNGELIKETAIEVDNTEDDPMVKYTIEKFDDNGISLSVMEAAQFLSFEKENAAEISKNRSVKRERKRVAIGGRNVDVLVATFLGESPYSLWFSDSISITGTVAMVAEIPGSEPYWSIQPLAFGSAGSQPDIRKYINSK